MPHQTKIFRVFISSTLTDMRAERGILQKDAFPRLEKFCEANRTRFHMVDMSLGLNRGIEFKLKKNFLLIKRKHRYENISKLWQHRVVPS